MIVHDKKKRNYIVSYFFNVDKSPGFLAGFGISRHGFESVWQCLAAFGIFFKMRLPTSEVDNFSLKMS